MLRKPGEPAPNQQGFALSNEEFSLQKPERSGKQALLRGRSDREAEGSQPC